MPMSKAGKKIMSNLKKQYGEKKGEGIFYAMENKGEIPGMKKKGYNVGGQVPKQPNQRQSQQISAFNRSQARAMNANRQTPGTMQAQRAAMSRRQGMNPADAQANQRNMAQAQRVAASRGPAQQARRAPSGGATPGARQRSAAELQRMTRTRPSSRRRDLFSSRRRRGFAEGGMVKSTGKLDTGIKKCGE